MALEPLTKYDPFIPRLRPKGWKVNLLTIETPGVRENINDLHAIPQNAIKRLMKNVHQNTIKHLTYLILIRHIEIRQTFPHLAFNS